MPNFPNLEAEMARHGISQNEMACALGVNSSTVSNWLNGKTEPKLKQLTAISDMLGGQSIDYLFAKSG